MPSDVAQSSRAQKKRPVLKLQSLKRTAASAGLIRGSIHELASLPWLGGVALSRQASVCVGFHGTVIGVVIGFEEAGRVRGSGTGPILLSRASFLPAHTANSGPVPLPLPSGPVQPPAVCQ